MSTDQEIPNGGLSRCCGRLTTGPAVPQDTTGSGEFEEERINGEVGDASHSRHRYIVRTEWGSATGDLLFQDGWSGRLGRLSGLFQDDQDDRRFPDGTFLLTTSKSRPDRKVSDLSWLCRSTNHHLRDIKTIMDEDFDIDNIPMYPCSLLRATLETALSCKIDSPTYSLNLPPILGRAPTNPGRAAWFGEAHLPFYIGEVIEHHRCLNNHDVYDYVFIHNVKELLKCSKTLARLVRKAYPRALMSNESAAHTLKVFLGLSHSRGGEWEYAKLDKSAQRKRVRPDFQPPEFFRLSKCRKLSVHETHCDPIPLDMRSGDVPIDAYAPRWSAVLSSISTAYHVSYMSVALRMLLPMAWSDSVSFLDSDLPAVQGVHGSRQHLSETRGT
ncbi:hypothetical protein Hypma_001329 [Hypsizygus marmoreus]|uniref:Uncharacterized protein n=1 Tax=Hypsizygus marmoreus TaxID=39966 RepID=A0A369K6N9_HYPMA|nr:hypothetical protein Hypma_001329 [Hypsizygus marmoreus]